MKVIQVDNPILRKKSAIIPREEIGKKITQNLIEKMSNILRRESAGIGLAAVQMGITKSIFIVSESALNPETLSEEETEEEIKEKKKKEKHLIFINPRLIKASKKKTLMHEGCLSVRGVYGKIKRSTNVTIEAYDKNGRKFKRGAGGLLAQVLQHEMDHLEGKLFIDKAEDIEKHTS